MPDPRPAPDAATLARWAESERLAEAELQARREAWGPQWPSWLSGTDIEPEPEAFL